MLILSHSFMRKFQYSVIALLLLATGCGEIELPQPDKGPSSEQTGEGNEGTGNNSGNTGTGNTGTGNNDAGDNSPGNSGSSDAEGKDENGKAEDSNPAAADLHIGNATLTADGHLLIADRLYLSLEEFWYVSSAYGSAPTQAAELAEAYVEGELTGWRVPTEADVYLLRDALACSSPYYYDEGTETLPPLNEELKSRSYQSIDREWYIYGDGSNVFGFTDTETFKKASKSNTYRLRLVHDK